MSTWIQKHPVHQSCNPLIFKESIMLNLSDYLQDLETIVNIDSGTYDIAGVNQVQDWFYKQFVDGLGYQATYYDAEPERLGQSILYSQGNDDHFDLLILCHADTVFPKGEATKRPFQIQENRVLGPGTADMKGGCLFALYALRELIQDKQKIGNIGIFFNGEHEIGCPNTRHIIEKLSRQSRIVIATECTRANGAYVKQRKGILRYKINFEGVSAHSGNNPEDGACAVLEMAHWIVALKALAEPALGISVNTGVVQGGTSVNTIPDHAELQIDIRVCKAEDAERIANKVTTLQAVNPKVTVTIQGGITRPPMVPNEKTEKICKMVEQMGVSQGITVKWASVGGGSDASFASAMGKPTLCGLGPTGRDIHTANEVLFLDDIHQRYEIFKEMLLTFSNLKDNDL